jgi:hypothetical protein
LLSENLPLTRSDKIKGETASKFAEWVTVTWKGIPGKTVEELFNKCCIACTLGGTEDD